MLAGRARQGSGCQWVTASTTWISASGLTCLIFTFRLHFLAASQHTIPTGRTKCRARDLAGILLCCFFISRQHSSDTLPQSTATPKFKSTPRRAHVLLTRAPVLHQ